MFRRLTASVNETTVKPRIAAAVGCKTTLKPCLAKPICIRRIFPGVEFCVAYKMSEKAIRFRHLDYDPDQAQKLISPSTSRHLSTRNISSKSMHTFLSNLANRQTDRKTDRQTDRQTWAIAFTSSSFVGDKNVINTYSTMKTKDLEAFRR